MFKKKNYMTSISADPPSPIASRTLTLVAKAVQNLANLVEFGAKVKNKHFKWISIVFVDFAGSIIVAFFKFFIFSHLRSRTWKEWIHSSRATNTEWSCFWMSLGFVSISKTAYFAANVASTLKKRCRIFTFETQKLVVHKTLF